MRRVKNIVEDIVLNKENEYVSIIFRDIDVEVKIDIDDCEIVNLNDIMINKTYVYIMQNGRCISLARVLLPDSRGRVYHRNKDPYDFRRENLFCGNKYYDMETYYIGECLDGRTFKVDKDDFEVVSKYIWHIDKNGYVIATTKDRNVVKQHRLVLGLSQSDNVEVDHIHHDITDNRKAMLRVVDRSLNCYNRNTFISNTSGVKGVYWSKPANKWCAQINVFGKRRYLGSFEKFDDAVLARKAAEDTYNKHINKKQQSAAKP